MIIRTVNPDGSTSRRWQALEESASAFQLRAVELTSDDIRQLRAKSDADLRQWLETIHTRFPDDYFDG